ncbi:MAG: hypothetical protein ACTSX9_09990 [Candidatus Njordarchaeales archaeon]
MRMSDTTIINTIYLIFSAATEALKAKNFGKVRELLKRAEQLSITLRDITKYAEVIHKLSDFYVMIGDDKKAKDLLENLLAQIQEEASKRSELQIEYLQAVTQAFLLRIYSRMGVFDNILLEKTLEMYKKLAKQYKLVDYYLSFLLTIYLPIKSQKSDKKTLRKILLDAISLSNEILEGEPSPDALPIIAETLVQLANIEIALEDYRNALTHVLNALEIYRQLENFRENFCRILEDLLDFLYKNREKQRYIDRTMLSEFLENASKKCVNFRKIEELAKHLGFLE